MSNSPEPQPSSVNAVGNALFSLLLIVLGGAILYFSRDIRTLSMGNHDPGPKAIPLGCAIIMTAGGLALLIKSFVFDGLVQNLRHFRPSINSRLLWTLISLTVYIALLDTLGFAIASILFLVICSKIFGACWFESVVTAVGIVLFVSLLFEFVFKVTLPRGEFL